MPTVAAPAVARRLSSFEGSKLDQEAAPKNGRFFGLNKKGLIEKPNAVLSESGARLNPR